MVHQVEAATSELAAASTVMVSPLRNWSVMVGSFSRRRVGKRKRPREGRLTTSVPPARVGKTVVRGDPATGQDPELVFTSISLGRDSSSDWNLGLTSWVLGSLLLAVLHQRAEHREECRQARVEQQNQLLQQVQWEHVVCEEWVQC